MSPTLGQLVAHSTLALEWAAGAEQSDREIRWVHASELADPAPYLEGGELLLTTGMRMTTSAPAARAYVSRLVDAGVAGLGFAVGITHDTVPKALITACTAAELPLLVVPEQTPFIQISKTVSDLIAAQEREELARGLESQRALVKAAADGSGALVARLAKEVRGWALLMDASGRPVHASPADAADRAPGLQPEIERIRPKGLLAGSSLAAGGERISLQPLGVDGRARSFLAVGAPEPWGRAVGGIVNAAVSLLSLDSGRSRPGEDLRERLEEIALTLAVHDQVHDRSSDDRLELPLDLLGWGWARSGPLDVTVVQIDGPGGRTLTTRIRDAGIQAVAARIDDQVVVVTPAGADGSIRPGGQDHEAADESAALDALLAPLLVASGPAAAGRAGCASFDDLADAVRRAQQALASRPRSASGVSRFDDLIDIGLMSLVDDDVADGFADAVLAPLLGIPASEDLLASLDAWLSRHGQWDAAAQELGVHRHTLRHRIRRIEGLLDRSLDDPSTRMELWFALRRRALRA